MRNRGTALIVVLLLLAFAGPADARRQPMDKASQRARLLGHEAGHVAASACAEDPEGDVVDAFSFDDLDEPRADVLEWCAEYGEDLVLRMRTADPADPRDDAGWLGFSTAVWLLDVTGDGEPDFQAEYGYGFGTLGVRVLRTAGAEGVRCEVGARFVAGAYVTAPIERACFGGGADLSVSAGMLYDTDPEDPEAPLALDETPPILQVRGEELPPGSANRDVRRIGGVDRFATAVAASREAYPDGALTVYLVRADDGADHAAAVGLAFTGPVLPVPACGPVPEVVLEEIRRLAAMEVVAVGGPDAVCEDVIAAAAAA